MDQNAKKELTPLPPQPVRIDDVGRRNSDLNDLKLRRQSSLVPLLLRIRKYSSVSFSVFAVLHGVSVVLAPSVSVDIADELVMMTRTIYQAPGLESVLVWGSLGLHVLSGILLRVMKVYKKRKNGVSRKKNEDKVTYIAHDDQKKLPPEYGLGGITSLLGLGARKSFVSRKFGLSPMSFAGYLLIPMILYHIYHNRLVPMIVDGGSSFVNLSFISHLISEHRWVTFPGLVALVWLSSYHMITGWMMYLNFYGKRSRKVAYFLINGMALISVLSLSNISKIGPAVGFVAKKFNSYLAY